VEGRLDFRREQPNIIAKELIPLEEIKDRVATKVKISLDAHDVSEKKVAEIRSICQHHHGKSPLFVAIRTPRGNIRTSAANSLSVDPDAEFCRKMKQLIGEQNFQLTR